MNRLGLSRKTLPYLMWITLVYGLPAVALGISMANHTKVLVKEMAIFRPVDSDHYPYFFVDSVDIDSVGVGVSAEGSTGMKVSSDAIETRITYKAKDSILFDVRHRKVYLFGEARVDYGDLSLGAAYMEIDFDRKELLAKGRIDSVGKYTDLPVFKDASREIGADTMTYNFSSKKGRMVGLKLQEGEGFVLCNRVFRDATGEIYTDIGKYTTCNHDHPHFYLNARKLKIIPEKKIIFGPANIVVEDVPLPLFLPFGFFPTKKGQTSGLIFPQYGYSALRGINLTNGGYYFHINDYIDQAITGDFFFRGSWGLRTATRYAKRYKYNGAVNLGYAYNIFGDRDDPNFRVSPDFKIRWMHTQDPKAKPGTGFNADVDIMSASYNLNNSFNANQIVSSQFRSTISYSKSMSIARIPSNLRMGMNHSQNTQTREFNVDLPNVNFDMNRFAIIPTLLKRKKVGAPKWYETISMSYSGNFSNRINTFDTLLNNPSILRDFNNGMMHTIPVFASFKFYKNYFTFNPSLNFTEYTYFKTIRKDWDPINNAIQEREVNGFSRTGVFSAAAEVNTRIFGTFKFRRSPTIEALRHVVTPSLTFRYSPDYSSDRFGNYRDIQINSAGEMGRYSIFERGIKGGPGRGQQGTLGYSIINNFELKKVVKTDSSSDFKYIKLIENLDINGNYNFLADSFQLSNLRYNIRTTLFDKVSIQMSGEMDPYVRGADRRVNRLQVLENGKLGTFTDFNFATSYAFNPETFKNGRGRAPQPPGSMLTDQEWRNIQMYPHQYLDFNVPWSLNMNYSFRYSASFREPMVSNLLNFSGDISLTENWKIAFNSGIDLSTQQISFTSFDFVRDLHCWQFNFNWIPFGTRKSFFFVLRAKSSLLQDLKINKNGFWFDNL